MWSNLNVAITNLVRTCTTLHPADAYGCLVLLTSAFYRLFEMGLGRHHGASSQSVPLLIFQGVGLFSLLVGRYLQERWEDSSTEPMRLSAFCDE